MHRLRRFLAAAMSPPLGDKQYLLSASRAEEDKHDERHYVEVPLQKSIMINTV